MIENSAIQAVCLGCCINPLWFNQWPYYYQPPAVSYTPEPIYSSLTEEEKTILHKLAEAYSLFFSLDKKSLADRTEFIDAIHRCQQIIALRVARRADPDIWHQPE